MADIMAILDFSINLKQKHLSMHQEEYCAFFQAERIIFKIIH